jgi:hypothetical protein
MGLLLGNSLVSEESRSDDLKSHVIMDCLMAPQQKLLMPDVRDTPQLTVLLCSLHATESLRFRILVPLHRFLKLSPRRRIFFCRSK